VIIKNKLFRYKFFIKKIDCFIFCIPVLYIFLQMGPLPYWPDNSMEAEISATGRSVKRIDCKCEFSVV